VTSLLESLIDPLCPHRRSATRRFNHMSHERRVPQPRLASIVVGHDEAAAG
jgi:hypothetical protein